VQTIFDLPKDLSYEAVAYLPSHGKMLVSGDLRSETGAQQPTRFWLADPATARAAEIKGQFSPLVDQTWRPLQTTGKPGEFWAAICDYKSNSTTVGRYDERAFAFTPAMTIAGLQFSSMAMWIDEEERGLYLAYNGDLLRLVLGRP